MKEAMEKWKGKVALVTGASAGIGLAVAERLVKHGLRVVGCARNIERIEVLAKSCPGSLHPIQCDVSKEDQVVAMFNEIQTLYGGVDILINNAGLGHNEPLLTGSSDQWKHMFDVNVLGLMVCCREAVKSMMKHGAHEGQIVLIGSMSGHRVLDRPSTHVYSATKFAVRAIAQGLRQELRARKSSIRVTILSPGLVDTEFYHRLYHKEPDSYKKVYSEHAPIQTEEVVDALLFVMTTPVRTQVHDVLMNPTEAKL